jgi:predicted XRE-type DNA-binding protein
MKQQKNLPGIEDSSGNVFADLELHDADELLVKSDLALAIEAAMERLGLTQVAAAKVMRIPQPRLSRILRGHVERVSEGKLIDCLTRLGENVRITHGPAPKGQSARAWVEKSARLLRPETRAV